MLRRCSTAIRRRPPAPCTHRLVLLPLPGRPPHLLASACPACPPNAAGLLQQGLQLTTGQAGYSLTPLCWGTAREQRRVLGGAKQRQLERVIVEAGLQQRL